MFRNFLKNLKLSYLIYSDKLPRGGRGGGELQKNWVGGGGVRPASQNPLPYFRPKSAIFLYPISDLTKNLIPYFRPDP